MLRSCKYCGKTHAIAETCALKPRAKPRRRDGGKERRFRNTAAWRKKRGEIQERDCFLCRYCFSRDILTYIGLEVHHIEPLGDRFDLRLNDGNLVTLCGGCHRKADGGEIGKAALRRLAKSAPPTIEARKKAK